MTKDFVQLLGLENRIQWLTEKLFPNLLSAFLVTIFLVLIWFVIKRFIKTLQKQGKIDQTVAAFIETVGRFTIFCYGGVTVLSEFGFDVASFLTGLGIVGLTLGFAAKDALSNVISGLFIFWDRPFVIGDLIEINNIYGRVERITMRSTRVVTVDGKMLAIPNTVIVNTPIASYTNFPHLRLDIEIGIDVEENIGRARAILLSLVDKKEEFMTEPKALVKVKSLNDYNVVLQLQVWIKEERSHISIRDELRERMYESFRAEGINMPFETIHTITSSIEGSKIE